MRVGIITFHKAINYGSVLQTWATQNLLEREGFEVDVIDYEPEHYGEIYDIFRHGMTASAIRFNLHRLPVSALMQIRRSHFSAFRRKNLRLTSPYYCNSQFAELEKYDCLISGSDQIWNVKIKDCDPIYFLPGIDVPRKIAYAVSMGNSDFSQCTDEQLMQYREWISDFDSISVREKATTEKIGGLLETKKEVICTLDPTLLHNKDDYLEIMSPRLVKEDYIFLYNIWNPDDGYRIARMVSERLRKPVYTLMTIKNVKTVVRVNKLGINVLYTKSAPGDYLSLIYHADCVITDSFHGTAFSIIFEKPMVCINYKMDNSDYKNDIRLRNILGLFDLQERYVRVDQLDQLDLEKQIDFKSVTERRMEIAQESIQWLMNAIR